MLIRGASAASARPPLFWHFPGYLGATGGTWRTLPGGIIRVGDWKLIEFFEDQRLELYNLRNDLSETRNLAATQPDKAKELRTLLQAWRRELNAPMPTPNLERNQSPPPPRPKAGKKGKRASS